MFPRQKLIIKLVCSSAWIVVAFYTHHVVVETLWSTGDVMEDTATYLKCILN